MAPLVLLSAEHRNGDTSAASYDFVREAMRIYGVYYYLVTKREPSSETASKDSTEIIGRAGKKLKPEWGKFWR